MVRVKPGIGMIGSEVTCLRAIFGTMQREVTQVAKPANICVDSCRAYLRCYSLHVRDCYSREETVSKFAD